jgi:Family of unknown function (DUF6459)
LTGPRLSSGRHHRSSTLENTVLQNTAKTPPVSDECSPPAWPIVDYEPPPVAADALCPSPSPAALRRHTPRPLRPVVVPAPPPRREHPELPPPRAAAIFADTILRRVLEVTDRRRPAAQVRRLLSPTVYDAIMASSMGLPSASPSGGAAVLRRVRLRTAETVDGEATAAEVFATYTRAGRVRAIAGRIEVVRGGWQVVALQIG